jgi:DNA-binding NarL/FixJ family response regulator
VDGHLRTEGGIDAARALCELAQDARILVLGSNDDLGTVVQGLRAGAFGVLSRDTPTEKLLDVLRRLREGECYLPPRFVPTLLEQLRTALSEGEQSNLLDRLTERERDVLSLMVCGLDRPAIAGRLYLSLNTVRTHVRNILAKLEASTRTQAVAIGIRHGLIE